MVSRKSKRSTASSRLAPRHYGLSMPACSCMPMYTRWRVRQIMVPVVMAPVLVLLFYADFKTRRLRVRDSTSPAKVESRSLWKTLLEVWSAIDAFLLILLGFLWTLVSLPLTLSASANDGYRDCTLFPRFVTLPLAHRHYLDMVHSHSFSHRSVCRRLYSARCLRDLRGALRCESDSAKADHQSVSLSSSGPRETSV